MSEKLTPVKLDWFIVDDQLNAECPAWEEGFEYRLRRDHSKDCRGQPWTVEDSDAELLSDGEPRWFATLADAIAWCEGDAAGQKDAALTDVEGESEDVEGEEAYREHTNPGGGLQL